MCANLQRSPREIHVLSSSTAMARHAVLLIVHALMAFALVPSVRGGEAPPLPSPVELEGQAVLERLVWPAGMTIRIADPVTLPGEARVGDLGKSAHAGEASRAAGLAGIGGAPPGGPEAAGGRGAPAIATARAVLIGPAGPAAAASPASPAALRIQELEARALELARSSLDLAKLLVMRDRRSRRPLLLFLVEQGVMTAAEVETFPAAPDADELVGRIRARVAALSAERDRDAVDLFLSSVERLKAARAGPR